MMDRTDRHFRYLMRLISPRAWLYTEMVTTGAVLNSSSRRHLQFDFSEHPVALQLGGGDPAELARAARIGEVAGFDEINLNVGCPSPRVKQGAFGAALMLDPSRVSECVAAMKSAVDIPVTVKTRLGVDDCDSVEYLCEFVAMLVREGLETLILHARKAWLSGLSPKQNRDIPPLDYARVVMVKRHFPKLEVIVNGGLNDVAISLRQLARVDGIMLGRAAYQQPMLMAEIGRSLGHSATAEPPSSIVARYMPYLRRQVECGMPLRRMTRHLLGLYAGRPGGKRWRRCIGGLSEGTAGLAELERLVTDMRDSTAEEGCYRAA